MFGQSPAAKVYVDKKEKGANRFQKECSANQGEIANQTTNGAENTISKRKFTFEELMSGRTSFKNWSKDNEESGSIEGGTQSSANEPKKVSSLKQKWELGSKSSISSCSSVRSSESGDDESSFGNVMKKFQSLQVRNKPALLSFSSFNPNTPTSFRTEDASPQNSTGSVSSRKDMFNNMAKQGKKNEWMRRSMSMKPKKKLSIEEPTVEEEGEEVQSEVRSISVRGKLAMFESLNEK
eukprot:TRINITY_DN225_c0_g2_i1.p1 TRINITY_DN225_c0_g2~~TRINITY_DN225_c0_g2_i1.p1  ORF type:complete len:237 (-),score=30.50 TRINITY_DN225_c0_g2_i1:264-974(-)